MYDHHYEHCADNCMCWINGNYVGFMVNRMEDRSSKTNINSISSLRKGFTMHRNKEFKNRKGFRAGPSFFAVYVEIHKEFKEQHFTNGTRAFARYWNETKYLTKHNPEFKRSSHMGFWFKQRKPNSLQLHSPFGYMMRMRSLQMAGKL
jgi:hypothetical protein